MLAELSEFESDALAELFNIGIGQAAASLSEMVSQEIELFIPTVKLLQHNDAAKILCHQHEGSVCEVKESFSGDFYGDAIMVFSEESSLALVHLLLEQNAPLATLTDMEQDALSEVGNIILTACISSIADILEMEIPTQIPTFSKGMFSTLQAKKIDEDETFVLFLDTKFRVKGQYINGSVSLVMGLHSLKTFRNILKEKLGVPS